VVKLREWKGMAMQVLAKLELEAAGEAEKRFLGVLIAKLDKLKYRDLAGFIKDLREYCRAFNRWDACRTLLEEPIEPGG